MPDPITFEGQLWRTTQDNEGETKVTFAFSSAELGRVLQLGTFTLKRLIITVKVDE